MALTLLHMGKPSADGIANLSQGEMKLLPITEWLPQYQRAYLRGDVIAGAALAGLLIPEAMGYAGIAGLPPQAGLYATLLGLLAYAIFGSSRQLVVSPTSASSAILAATVAPLAAADSPKVRITGSSRDAGTGWTVSAGGHIEAGLHRRLHLQAGA
jgi:sulfate permease, SulP family